MEAGIEHRASNYPGNYNNERANATTTRRAKCKAPTTPRTAVLRRDIPIQSPAQVHLI